MEAKRSVVEIDDLYINFYTKAGTVFALDGVNLVINKGETLGLVGESGCGKSVTANSIMRLIPCPPGKIEKGRILYFDNDLLMKEMQDLDRRALLENADQAALAKEREELLKKMADFEALQKRWEEVRKLKDVKGSDHPDVVKAVEEMAPELDKYDILKKPDAELRSVRGNAISMIFQEPMTSLNPVFTAGEQIAEIILLHERRELAEAILKRMEEEEAEGAKKKADKVYLPSGEYQCAGCKMPVDESAPACPQCGASFESGDSVRGGRGYHRRMMKKIVEDPNSFSLKVTSKVPIMKRYQRLLEQEAMHRAIEMLKMVRVPDPQNVAKSYPYELSGGMQQRVMIAMALACKPHLLIADEPTTALDVTIQAQILKLMRDLQEQTGTTILLITHNLGVVAEVCERVGVMYAGTMAEIGQVNDIFAEPLHPYTQGLINAIPRINQDVQSLETIEGSVPNLTKPPSGCRFHPRCPYVMNVCRSEKPALQEIGSDHWVACHLYRRD